MYRKIHKTPEMKLNEEMSKEAEEYAKKLAEEKKFQHSDSEDGENLAMGCSSKDEDLTAEEATEHW